MNYLLIDVAPVYRLCMICELALNAAMGMKHSFIILTDNCECGVIMALCDDQGPLLHSGTPCRNVF